MGHAGRQILSVPQQPAQGVLAEESRGTLLARLQLLPDVAHRLRRDGWLWMTSIAPVDKPGAQAEHQGEEQREERQFSLRARAQRRSSTNRLLYTLLLSLRCRGWMRIDNSLILLIQLFFPAQNVRWDGRRGLRRGCWTRRFGAIAIHERNNFACP